jgi:hypothetical protein
MRFESLRGASAQSSPLQNALFLTKIPETAPQAIEVAMKQAMRIK